MPTFKKFIAYLVSGYLKTLSTAQRRMLGSLANCKLQANGLTTGAVPALASTELGKPRRTSQEPTSNPRIESAASAVRSRSKFQSTATFGYVLLGGVGGSQLFGISHTDTHKHALSIMLQF
jgi:hypothetical protein